MVKKTPLCLTLSAIAVLGAAEVCPAQAPPQARAMVLEVLESSGGKPQKVVSNPDVPTIERTVRGLSWSDMTFVVLRKDEKNFLEGSGSLNPSDGLSARYVENGVEHISRRAPESLQVIVALLTSYRSGDGKWRTMIEWE